MALLSGIKSIQRGTITVSAATSNTATITSVDTTKTLISKLGSTTTVSVASYEPGRSECRVELTNATTVTAYKNTSTDSITVGYQVVEYY